MKIIFEDGESRADAVVALSVAEHMILEDMEKNLDLAEEAECDDMKKMFRRFAASDHNKLLTIRRMLEVV